MTPQTTMTSDPFHTTRRIGVLLALAGAALSAQAAGETIGTVDTAFKLIGRDHDIIVEAYDDPAVATRACSA